MSLDEAKQEAEAVIDSAEMLLDTFPGEGKTARELRGKITELEQEVQDPDSERSLRKLVEEIKELMDDLEEQGMDSDPMGPGMEEGGGMGPQEPEDDMPPF